MKFRYSVAASTVALSIASFSGAAFAQSTGSIEVEEGGIVVNAAKKEKGLEGVELPDSAKPRVVINAELLEKQSSGQSVLNTINMVPGVNFTNSDAYGSSGGNLRIRGFDGNRISLTFDGFPLNDTGNYAIFSNQQLDPELVSSVNVNLGTTDVDSPTASAAGGTVNYRTRVPSNDMHFTGVLTLGDDKFSRIFGEIETGEFTSFGTKAFLAASRTRYNKFKGPGGIYKRQFNAGIYQPIGDNGDFIYLMGHYNVNRNAFYRNPQLSDLRTIMARPLMVDVGGFTAADRAAIMNFENLSTCNHTNGLTGVVQNDNSGTGLNGTGAAAPAINGSAQNNVLNTSSCTNYYGLRINPSNTGNIRANSKFSLTDRLTLTLDAAYQYVLANGGGTNTISETSLQVRGATSLAGYDLNGDTDTLDTVRFYTPNTTNTRRVTLLASLIYQVADHHRVRVAYTLDRGRHRQTGEWGYLLASGSPENVFGGRNGRPVFAADGSLLRQRDRLSIALLNQISAEYKGDFMDERLNVMLGLRMPFFKRNLNQYCYTQAAGGGTQVCTTQPVGTTALAGVTYIVPPTYVLPTTVVGTPVFAPFSAQYKFSPVLPNVGFNFKATDNLSVFGSYAKGFSSPRTDNLYRAPVVKIDPETTDTFDLGVRYNSRDMQLQASYWHTNFKNRIVTSFDSAQGISVDRNIGSVKGQGVDIGLAVRPYKWFTFQGNASYNDSKLQNDIAINSTLNLPTAGKFVVETPKWTLGYRAQVEYGPASLGLQVKYVGKRFATDMNDIRSPAYTTADLDARFDLDSVGLKKSWLQVNVVNLFNRFYLGNISTQIAGPTNIGLVTIPSLAVGAAIPGGASPSWAIGAPRTFSATLHVGI